jgi:hypothetical protein
VQSGELEVNDTEIPEAGADDPSLIVPVAGFPPTTEAGLNARDATFGAATVKVALAVLLPRTAWIVAEVEAPTGVVDTVNVIVFAPVGTVIEAGTVAAEVDELNVTAAPAVPALADRVTVPKELLPPVTEVGDRRKLAIVWEKAGQTAPAIKAAAAANRYQALASAPKQRSTLEITTVTLRRSPNVRRVSHPFFRQPTRHRVGRLFRMLARKWSDFGIPSWTPFEEIC